MYNTFDESSYVNWLAHVGVDHTKGNPGSGRYEWGSGEHPYQRADFNYDDYLALKKSGMSEKEIAEHFKILDKTGKGDIQSLRDNVGIAAAYRIEDNRVKVADLYNHGMTKSKDIAEKLGLPESTVRKYIKESPSAQETRSQIFNTADVLRESVDAKGIIDISKGTELILGVKDTTYKKAQTACENDGYKIYVLYQDQLGNNKQQTAIKVLCKPDMTYQDAIKSLQNAEIGLPKIEVHSEDGGLTFYGIEHPKSLDSSRIEVAFDKSKDGLVEVRRGVDDVSLGENHYAQVRIAVDGTHYIKGMCVYSDNLPEGVDVRVYSNKKPGTPLTGEDPENSVLKPMKRTKNGDIDYDNPFGAQIKMKDGVTVGQHHYVDENGKTQLSCINIINEEGDWATWKKHLSSQMLSKQSMDLINQQLDISLQAKQKEFEEINQIANPTVRKTLLNSFAESCDSQAVDLDAAAMPRQASHAILPVGSLKDNEIYAPNYRDGERVILIRYPHAGTFEIPELIVNNRNKEAQDMIGSQARDAVGITQKTAAKLSGADFDGDTVLVIPNNRGQIGVNNSAKFKELQDFDTKIYYKKGFEVSEDTKQMWMGKCTNLIADMTLKGAPAEDLIPAVKFSMVIIDAKKHNLNWPQAYQDYGIDKLNEKYRGRANAGASTIITRAGAEVHPYQRRAARSSKENGIVGGVDVNTGKKVYEETGKMRTRWKKNKETGEWESWTERVTEKHKRMELVEDAYELVGDPDDPKERAYANFANSLKKLANESRRISVNTENMKKNSEAAKTYAKEVASLNEKLKSVKMNSFLERQAQVLANKRFFAAKNNSSVPFTKDELKRLKSECLAGARLSVGAKKPKILITPKEWEAIEAGAISSSILSSILRNTSEDIIRGYTMPRATQRSKLSYTDEATIRAMANRPGVTQAEIADALGISVSTVNQVLHE